MNLDDILGSWKEYLKKDKIKIVNLQKLNDIMAAYRILSSIINIQDKDVTVEIREGDLEFGDIYIRIVAHQFTSYDIEALTQAISKADNIDIYPTADYRIKIDVMFYKAYYVSTI
ncbi:MAG: hypothetical protein J6S71_00300 [Clostridia bacterium]|nr:hypothetical protein [Clostridia bacterium]